MGDNSELIFLYKKVKIAKVYAGVCSREREGQQRENRQSLKRIVEDVVMASPVTGINKKLDILYACATGEYDTAEKLLDGTENHLAKKIGTC